MPSITIPAKNSVDARKRGKKHLVGNMVITSIKLVSVEKLFKITYKKKKRKKR